MLQYSHKRGLKNLRYDINTVCVCSRDIFTDNQPQEMNANANANALVPLLYKRYANALIAGAAGLWRKRCRAN